MRRGDVLNNIIKTFSQPYTKTCSVTLPSYFAPFHNSGTWNALGKKKCIYFLSVPSFQLKKKIPMLYHYLYNPWKLTTWRAIIWVLQGDESWPSELKLKTTWDIVPCFLPMSHIQISSFQCAHLNQAKWHKNRLQCVVRLTTIY